MKKRVVRKEIIIIFVLVIVCIFLGLFGIKNFKSNKITSIHEEAKKYSKSGCVAYYPDSSYGKSKAKEFCKTNNLKGTFDYTLIPYGDYYLVNYGNNFTYFVDNEFNEIVFNKPNEDAKNIFSDYLRVTIKEQNPDLYYNLDFLEATYKDNLNVDNLTYKIEGEYLLCTYPDYEVSAKIPLKYVKECLNMDFGYGSEKYVKPTYIDPQRPVIALTFDDGPYYSDEEETFISNLIVETLYKYDVDATFFVLGCNAKERYYVSDAKVYSFLNKSLRYGNEYGSHTENHYTLTDLNAEEIKEEINGPIEYFKKFLNYDMKLYRPVGGVFSDEILEIQSVPAILWNVDSRDWYYLEAEDIYNNVMNSDVDNGDVLIFHDVYYSSYEAIEMILPEFIEKGYQIVKVSDLLDYLKININELKYFYDSNYYE